MDMMELSQALQQLRAGDPASTLPWVSALRSQGLALTEVGPELLSAISVTTQMTGESAAEAEAVRRVSQLLADEFHLTASVRIDGRAVSVRFAHPIAA